MGVTASAVLSRGRTDCVRAFCGTVQLLLHALVQLCTRKNYEESGCYDLGYGLYVEWTVVELWSAPPPACTPVRVQEVGPAPIRCKKWMCFFV